MCVLPFDGTHILDISDNQLIIFHALFNVDKKCARLSVDYPIFSRM